MSDVQLSRQSLTRAIVTFNANTIGYFTASGFAGGMHVGHIKSIQVTANNKGKHALSIDSELLTFINNERIDDAQLDKAREWVAEVQRALQSISL